MTLFVSPDGGSRFDSGRRSPDHAHVILRLENLSKVFEVGIRRRRMLAVDDLTLSVEEGEVFGFVGPNGAGKTTTIKMLMGLIYPTRGRAFIFDAPIPSREARRRLGYLPENPSYYEFLTGREALRFFAELAEVSPAGRARRCDELLELVGLASAADLQLRKYSKGMQQRLGIAQAIVADPALVILDEPMSGLDPVGRKEMRDIILDLKRRGKTVFFSTHILPDVEVLCDRVAIILGGRLRDVGRLGELLSPRVKSVEVTLCAPTSVRARLGANATVLAQEGDHLDVSFPNEAAADAAVRAVLAAGGQILAVTPNRETLEDFFVRRLEEDRAGVHGGAPRARADGE